MTKFKKCDDCGIILTKEIHKVKTTGGLGQSKTIFFDNNNLPRKETSIVIFLCKDCYNFHENDNKNPNDESSLYLDTIQTNSALDKIIAKKSTGTWHKKELKLQ